MTFPVPGARAAAACVLAVFVASATQASPAQDYMLYCMGCHGTGAQGVAGKVPPLAGALARFMRNPAGRDYVLRVPGAANSALSDEELAAVLNWIARTYDGAELSKSTPPFTAAEVARVRHSPLASVPAARNAVLKSLAASGAAPPPTY